jgi:hypothetical protein
MPSSTDSAGVCVHEALDNKKSTLAKGAQITYRDRPNAK